MIRRCAVAGLLLLAARAGAQTVTARDLGQSGLAGRILRGALAAPHLLVTPTRGSSDLPRDTTYSTTVIILGRDATVASTVHGDVIVVGGDLNLHPGAHIDGRAVAIGGGVYNSSLAMSGADKLSFRDFTYDIKPFADGYALDFRWIRQTVVERLTWPALGFRIPGYDRSDGLSIGFGPKVTLDTGAVVIDPRITYRSQLGKFDPALALEASLDRRTRIQAFAGRGTFSNDTWIYSDLLNTASSFFLGDDARNFFRADRAELILHHTFDGATAVITPYLGGRYERSWSVRPDIGATSGPWSFLGRRSLSDMLRPNPRVIEQTFPSVLGGAHVEWASQGVRIGVVASEEVGFPTSGQTFAQTTLDGIVRFPTFGTQRYRLDGHAVLTGGPGPRQRYAYIGGAGTIVLMELLEQGGDQLLFLDSRYDIPLDAIVLPFVGSPMISLRHVLGGAGVGSLPTLEQRVGVRVAVNVVRGEFLIDPATRRTFVGVGLSVAR